MSRRRLMMLQQSKPDLLEGCRIDNLSGYKVHAIWLDNNTVELKHTSAGFMGPNTAALNFIGTSRKQSTGVGSAMDTVALPTVELGQTYKLTLTVIDIIKNTATAENDGELSIAMGRGGGGTTSFIVSVNAKFSELQIGNKFELVKAYNSTVYPIAGAAFGFSNPNLLWNIKFKVDFEEV